MSVQHVRILPVVAVVTACVWLHHIFAVQRHVIVLICQPDAASQQVVVCHLLLDIFALLGGCFYAAAALAFMRHVDCGIWQYQLLGVVVVCN